MTGQNAGKTDDGVPTLIYNTTPTSKTWVTL